jgi:hypothetical protein
MPRPYHHLTIDSIVPLAFFKGSFTRHRGTPLFVRYFWLSIIYWVQQDIKHVSRPRTLNGLKSMQNLKASDCNEPPVPASMLSSF